MVQVTQVTTVYFSVFHALALHSWSLQPSSFHSNVQVLRKLVNESVPLQQMGSNTVTLVHPCFWSNVVSSLLENAQRYHHLLVIATSILRTVTSQSICQVVGLGQWYQSEHMCVKNYFTQVHYMPNLVPQVMCAVQECNIAHLHPVICMAGYQVDFGVSVTMASQSSS